MKVRKIKKSIRWNQWWQTQRDVQGIGRVYNGKKKL